MRLYNKWIPFKGYSAMAIWPIIFVRGDEQINGRTLRHEKIHFEQQKEMLLIPFYIAYLILWPIYGYRNIPFEKEAYSNQDDINYLKTRKRFSWLKYF